MTEKVMRHKELCDGLNTLYARKNHDYGDSFHQTFIEEGLAMARIRLGDKFSRFKTLSRISPTDSAQQQVTDESIRDTLLDLANYAIMTVLELDEVPVATGKRLTVPEQVHELHKLGLPAEEIGHRLKISIDAVRTLTGESSRNFINKDDDKNAC